MLTVQDISGAELQLCRHIHWTDKTPNKEIVCDVENA